MYIEVAHHDTTYSMLRIHGKLCVKASATAVSAAAAAAAAAVPAAGCAVAAGSAASAAVLAAGGAAPAFAVPAAAAVPAPTAEDGRRVNQSTNSAFLLVNANFQIFHCNP